MMTATLKRCSLHHDYFPKENEIRRTSEFGPYALSDDRLQHRCMRCIRAANQYRGDLRDLALSKGFISDRSNHTRDYLRKVVGDVVYESLVQEYAKNGGGTPGRRKFRDDSTEVLERLLNLEHHRGISHVRKTAGNRLRPNRKEIKLHNQADEYAEKVGVLWSPGDKFGFPDRRYDLGTTLLGWVEFKIPGKQPDRDQIKRILQLRKYGHIVRVIDNFDYFKTWLNDRVVAATAVAV